jgi:hypothetical protein
LEADRHAESANLELPDYDFWRLALAGHPLCVVDAFQVSCRLVIARLLGLRMCPQCPFCNFDNRKRPCQDEFGSNMLPMGGCLGACESLGGVVEHQRHGTPHLHALAALVTVFQHNTLAEIATLLEKRLKS